MLTFDFIPKLIKPCNFVSAEEGKKKDLPAQARDLLVYFILDIL